MNAKAESTRAKIAAKWEATRPLATALIIGLVAGPIISNLAGFQVRASTAQAAARAGIVEQQAIFCAERARAATPDTAALDWPRRNELAQKWAVMPGSASADPDAVYACSMKLGR